ANSNSPVNAKPEVDGSGTEARPLAHPDPKPKRFLRAKCGFVCIDQCPTIICCWCIEPALNITEQRGCRAPRKRCINEPANHGGLVQLTEPNMASFHVASPEQRYK